MVFLIVYLDGILRFGIKLLQKLIKPCFSTNRRGS